MSLQPYVSVNSYLGNVSTSLQAQTSVPVYESTIPFQGPTYYDFLGGWVDFEAVASILRGAYGDWSDIKPSLGAGPLESGVFDTAGPYIPPLLPGPLGGGTAAVLASVVGPGPAEIEEFPEQGGGYQPGGPFESAPPIVTDWGEVTILDEAESENDMAIDWGNIVSGAIDIAQGQQPGGNWVSPGPTNFMPAGGAGNRVPREVTVDTVTGEVKKCKRRRRRRLLTPTDLSDLAALQAIVGKGDALKLAVAKAVRR